MTELTDLAGSKLNQSLGKITEDLSKRIHASQRDLAARGLLKSGMSIRSVLNECFQTYDEATNEVTAEIDWIFKNSLYVREAFARRLIDFGIERLITINLSTMNHLERVIQLTGFHGDQDPIRAELKRKQASAEESIRLFVRQRRIEKPRTTLKSLFAPLFSILNK